MFTIAGATGHVGGVAAKLLLQQGQKVRAIVRSEEKGAQLKAAGAELAVGELGDQAFMTAALRGTRGAFLLLPSPSALPESAEAFYAFQRQLGQALAAAVKESGVPHVVLLSSVGADMPEGNGPIKGLFHLENALRETGVKLTAIRAGYFQENAGGAIGPARAQGTYYSLSPADYAFPMVATRDIGKLAARLLRNPPARSEVVDLHGPSYSPRQIAEKIGKAVGKTLKIVEVPPPGHVAAFEQAGMSRELAEGFAEMQAGFASGAIQPKGDRAEKGTTTFDEVLPSLLG